MKSSRKETADFVDSRGTPVMVGDQLYSSGCPTFMVRIVEIEADVATLVEIGPFGGKQSRINTAGLANSSWIKYGSGVSRS